jgi:hypothetical protein
MSLILLLERVPSSLILLLLEIFPPTIKAAFFAIINNKKYTNRKRFLYKKFICLQVFLDMLKLVLIN